VVKQNPLENIANESKIEGVVVFCTWLAREEINKLLEEIAD
jgi:hypothetical protein